MSKNAASSSAEASVAAGATAVLVSALRFQRAAAVAAATPELAFQLSYAFGVIRFGGILRAPLASSVRTSFFCDLLDEHTTFGIEIIGRGQGQWAMID
jgi:hypothetical protein